MTLWRTVGCSAVFYRGGTRLAKSTPPLQLCPELGGFGKTFSRDLCTIWRRYISWNKSSFWYTTLYSFCVLLVNGHLYVIRQEQPKLTGWTVFGLSWSLSFGFFQQKKMEAMMDQPLPRFPEFSSTNTGQVYRVVHKQTGVPRFFLSFHCI